MNVKEFINSIFMLLTFVAFLAQCFIDFSSENIASACIVFSAAFMTLFYMRWTKASETHPLSTFAIFGFCITSQLGALLAQSGSGVSLINGLRQPIETFSTLTFYLILALVAHSFYRMFSLGRGKSLTDEPSILRRILSNLGIYKTPSAINLWVMGFIGLIALLLGSRSAVAKGMSFLAWSPFLIPIYVKQFGTDYCVAKLHYLFLAGYFVLIALFAMTFGARGIMLTGVATVSLIFMLLGMQSKEKVGSKLVAKIAVLGTVGLALSLPLSDLVTAMAIAKVHRDKNLTAEKMIEDTFYNFSRQDILEKYRSQVQIGALTKSYDEYYIENPILARFTETKFHDNTLYFASKMSTRSTEDLAKVTKDFLWNTLPQPVLDWLKIGVDKSKLNYSMGDYIVEQVTGLPVGGRKTGSIFGQGIALFGWMFPVIYFFTCFILFVTIDIFSFRTSAGFYAISALGMLKIWPTFLYGITSESIHAMFIAVVREVVQVTFLYLMVYYLSNSLSIFSKTKKL